MSKNKDNMNSDEMLNLNTEPNQKSGGKKTGIICGVIIGVLVVAYVGCGIFFQSRFNPSTTVNGTSATGKTAAQVMDDVYAAADAYSLTITDADGNETVIEPADIDLTVSDATDVLNEYISAQNGFLWPISLFSATEYESEVLLSYDESKLKNILNNLPSVTKKNITESEDATYIYDGSEFVIQPEVYGDEVDTKALAQSAEDAILSMEENLNLSDAGLYIQPTVLSDDEKLVETVDTLNSKLGLSFEYVLDDGTTEKLDEETLLSFVDIDGTDISYNEDNIRAFVQEMEEKYNTTWTPMTIHSQEGVDVEVSGGTYGYEIDEDGEVEQILADLEAGEDVSRDFVYSQTAMGGRSGPGSLYIEVNRTAQRFWVVKDGEVVLTDDVVTGKPTNGHSTTLGTWYIQFMKSPDILDGYNDDGSEYHTKVSYWMPFYNGEGFHDATWQPSFGGTYYKVRGSHGCVNLSLSTAGKLYSLITPGTPVFIYELAGTERDTTSASQAASMIQCITENEPVFATLSVESDAAMRAIWARWNSLDSAVQAQVTNAAELIAAHDAMNAIRAANGMEVD